VEWEGVLALAGVGVELWERAQLWCSPVPSLSSRTAVGLETKQSPTVRSPSRSRKVATSLSLTAATEEVG